MKTILGKGERKKPMLRLIKRRYRSDSPASADDQSPNQRRKEVVSHRDFLKLLGASIGAGLVSQVVAPAEAAFAQTLGDPDATVTGNLYVSGPAEQCSEPLDWAQCSAGRIPKLEQWRDAERTEHGRE